MIKKSSLTNKSSISLVDAIAGDGICIPTKMGCRNVIVQISILARQGRKLFLSAPAIGGWSHRLWRRIGPFYWDDKRGVLVDRSGRVQRWFTLESYIERGAAIDVSERYNAVHGMKKETAASMSDDSNQERFAYLEMG